MIDGMKAFAVSASAFVLVTGVTIGVAWAQASAPATEAETVHGPRMTKSAAATSGESGQARNSRPSGKPYYVEFRARHALSYGHTFAVVARVGEKLTKSHVHGLHPATESPVPWMIGHVIPVVSETGWSDGDIEDRYISAKYRIYLTATEHKKLMEKVTALKASSPVWHAVLYNCNAFVGDIAKAIGLRAPSSWLKPKEYITELKALNAGRQAVAVPATM